MDTCKTVCTSLDQIAALVSGHDGVSVSTLVLDGTDFIVNLGPRGRLTHIVKVPIFVSVVKDFYDQIESLKKASLVSEYSRTKLDESLEIMVNRSTNKNFTDSEYVLRNGNTVQDAWFDHWANAMAFKRQFKAFACIPEVSHIDTWEVCSKYVLDTPIKDLHAEPMRVSKEIKKLPKTFSRLRATHKPKATR